MWAAISGNAAAVRAVVGLGVADKEMWDKDGWTAFLWACNGSVECIGALAEAGCDKDAATDDGATALMAAAISRQVAQRLERAEQIARQKEDEMLAELEEENGRGGGAAEPVGAKSKAQMKRERQRRRQNEQAARDELAALLDQLGLSEHLTLCLDNEMDIGASATLDHPPFDTLVA